MRRWSAIVGMSLLACLVAGCASGRAVEAPTVAGAIYLMDDTDAGDEPFVAGCHWSFTDDACTQTKQFHDGDFCGATGLTLAEWTNRKCHAPEGDLKMYDCDAECKKIGKPSGRCQVVANACGNNNDSARCVCDDVTGAPRPRP